MSNFTAHDELKYDCQYKETLLPLWRGAKFSKSLNLNNYNPNTIGELARLTSTSKQRKQAFIFGTDSGSRRKAVIYKIFLANKDKPATNIDLAVGDKADWVFYESEEEVILFPFFQFQVMSKVVYKNVCEHGFECLKEVIQITLMEIPFQNLFRIRQIYQLSVIFFADPDTEFEEVNSNKDFQENMNKNSYNSFIGRSEEQIIEVVRQSVRVVLVVEPRNGSKFIHTYFGNLKHPDNINSVILYCTDIESHTKWTNNFTVKGRSIHLEVEEGELV